MREVEVLNYLLPTNWRKTSKAPDLVYERLHKVFEQIGDLKDVPTIHALLEEHPNAQMFPRQLPKEVDGAAER